MDPLWVRRYLIETYLSIGKVYMQDFGDEVLYFKPTTRQKNGKLVGKMATIFPNSRSKPKAKKISVDKTQYSLWKPAPEVPAQVQSVLSESLDEVSPPGWEASVKAMKKHKSISNPWALAWYMKNKGAKPGYKMKGGKPVKKEEQPPAGRKFMSRTAKYKLAESTELDLLERASPTARMLVGTALERMKAALSKAYPTVQPSMMDAVLTHYLMRAMKEIRSMAEEAGQESQGASFIERKPRLGSGERFKALSKSIAARGGVRDPDAVAAAIGRKKYGKKKFQALAKAGK